MALRIDIDKYVESILVDPISQTAGRAPLGRHQADIDMHEDAKQTQEKTVY